MANFLKTLEENLQSLLEGSLDRLLYPGISHSLSARLVNLIDAKLEQQADPASKQALDLITITVAPEKWDAWQECRPTLDEVSRQIEQSWTDEGYTFATPLRICLAISEQLTLNDIEITVDYARQGLESSPTTLLTTTREPDEDPLPLGAYFIINGKEQVYLTRQFVNIGRRSTSDIVIRDPMVSREHLQLRAQRGRYLLFDLSTTGGTFVNNHPVKTAVLKPGDVIRVGKTIMIYNQDMPMTSTHTTVMNSDE